MGAWGSGARRGRGDWYVDRVDDTVDPDTLPAAPVVDVVDREELLAALIRALSTLPRRDQDVIVLRFGLLGRSYTLKECARLCGLGSAGVLAAEQRGLKRLRLFCRACYLLPWAEGNMAPEAGTRGKVRAWDGRELSFCGGKKKYYKKPVGG